MPPWCSFSAMSWMSSRLDRSPEQPCQPAPWWPGPWPCVSGGGDFRFPASRSWAWETLSPSCQGRQMEGWQCLLSLVPFHEHVQDASRHWGHKAAGRPGPGPPGLGGRLCTRSLNMTGLLARSEGGHYGSEQAFVPDSPPLKLPKGIQLTS